MTGEEKKGGGGGGGGGGKNNTTTGVSNGNANEMVIENNVQTTVQQQPPQINNVEVSQQNGGPEKAPVVAGTNVETLPRTGKQVMCVYIVCLSLFLRITMCMLYIYIHNAGGIAVCCIPGNR